MKYLTLIILNILLILNVQGQDHKRIKGTKVYLDIPEGFKEAEGFIGLQKGDFADIILFEAQGSNYYQATRNYTKNNFIRKGIDVITFKNTTINDYHALSDFQIRK